MDEAEGRLNQKLLRELGLVKNWASALQHVYCGLPVVAHGASWPMPALEGASAPAGASGDESRGRVGCCVEAERASF
jgi:hypothetical protein